MKRSAPWEEAHAISSDSDSEEDVIKLKKLSEGELINKKAETYQEFMKLIKIPANRGSLIPFTSWQGLGQSVKQLYRQPLHYLTNILLKQWDLSRVGSPDEHRPLDSLVHPLKAEALIWVTEETHRRTASHHYVAKLWVSDPLYHANIDGIFPAKEDIQQMNPNLFS